MIFLCPADCEHDEYEFAHTIVTKSHRERFGGVWCDVTRQYVICRECGHWITRDMKGYCGCRCHAKKGGTRIAVMPIDQVE